MTLHTSLGDLKAEIFCEEVPRTAENFLALAAAGTYDGTLFHRNIRGFMIQGGDPTGAQHERARRWQAVHAVEHPVPVCMHAC